jgi:DNA-binding NarL/FixJ family response regulator
MHKIGAHQGNRKAVIVHGQGLMLPFLADVLRCAGHGDVLAYRSPSAKTLHRAKPDVVVLDADAPGSDPLDLIRITRAGTRARIVVITRYEDRLWNALARALGADAVLGPQAGRQDLFSAVASA